MHAEDPQTERVKTILLVLIVCAGCTRRPTELVVVPASPQPGPWLALRDALSGCAAQYGLSGELRVLIAVDPDGGPGSVTSDQGDAVAVCIGRAIVRWRYREHINRIMDIRFALPGPA